MYTSDYYLDEATKKVIGTCVLRLSYEVILHATFFPAGQCGKSKHVYFKKKLNFLQNHKLFDITCDLISEKDKSFDKDTFRIWCINTLIRNYENSNSNRTYIKNNADRKAKIEETIKTTHF